MNKYQVRIIGFLLLIFGLVWGTAWAETLYVQRPKVDIREGQGSFFPVIYSARMGEALEAQADPSGWYQVKTPKGPGWVYKDALASKQPSSMAGFTGTADTSELDKTAGFKGFDAPTEQAYVSKNNLQAQMRQVDRLQIVPFTVADLMDFQKKGQVGRRGAAR